MAIAGVKQLNVRAMIAAFAPNGVWGFLYTRSRNLSNGMQITVHCTCMHKELKWAELRIIATYVTDIVFYTVSVLT